MKTIKILSAFLLLLSALASCNQLPGSSGSSTPIEASGIVEASEVAVSSELGGTVSRVLVEEGDAVQAGAPLFELEGGMLAAQRGQAEAAIASAQANIQTANVQLEAARSAAEAAGFGVRAAQVQYDLALMAARAEEAPLRAAAWAAETPDDFVLPAWYFEKPETIQAAQANLEAAAGNLEDQKTALAELLGEGGLEGLEDAESRLAVARLSFSIAQELLDRETAASLDGKVSEFVQDYYDDAQTELESAQEDYDRLLSDQDAEDVLEARGRLAVAQARYDLAMDQLNALQTGEQSPTLIPASLQIRQAELGKTQAEIQVRLAEAALGQAEALLGEAQAALAAIDAQMEKLVVYAPMDGVVLVRGVQPGEVLAPGGPALVLGQLSNLKVTVYVAEDQYGQVTLGQVVEVFSDSFPGTGFEATVERISDQAEFTPRNVQTQEDRSTTVYAVELSLADSGGDLKPGMPVDVQFGG